MPRKGVGGDREAGEGAMGDATSLRERARAVVEGRPERWWLTREVASAAGGAFPADVSARLGALRRLGLVESRHVNGYMLEWRWRDGRASQPRGQSRTGFSGR